MKLKHYYLLLSFFTAISLHGQKVHSPVDVPANESTTAQDPSARYFSGQSSQPSAYAPGCAVSDALGSASNVYTQILTEANPIAVDASINTVVYLHRNNAGVFGGHSGQLRYDVSTNGGITWTNNSGPLNPSSVNGTNAARYPNVAIYNPAGNTTPSNAYLGYLAATVATTWNGTVSGVRRLSGTGNTENYNQAGSTQTLIPRSMVKGAPGTYWAIDAVYDGTNVLGYRILKGVWNGSSDIVWSVNTTLTPAFNTLYDGVQKTSDFAIAFDPSGTIGWVCLLTHTTGSATNYAFHPNFYKTTDGGSTWSGPTQVDLGQFPCISNNILAGNVATAGFDLDLTVDIHGNPHALMPVGNGNNAYAIFFTNWHAMVDLTMMDGLWNPIVLSNVYRGRGTWGTAPNTVTQDMEPGISRSADGTKIYFTWTDADSSVAIATANQSPNLYAKAYNVMSRTWTSKYSLTACNPTWNGKAMFPKVAPEMLNQAGGNKLPVVIAQLGANDDPVNPAFFHFLDSLIFSPNDFMIPQCQAMVSVATTDTVYGCDSLTLMGTSAMMYLWNTGATTQSITVSTSGMYKLAVSDGCCIGSDSVYVVINSTPLAAFGGSVNGFAASFSNTSSGNNNAYLWDFGDGNTSTAMSPNHTYAGPGTYLVCLTVSNSCGTDSSCQTVVATCAPQASAWSFSANGLLANFSDLTSGSPLAWNWAFGDGQFSTLQNPSHAYVTAGLYTVCLAITDSCGSDTTCQLVSVCDLPSTNFNVQNLGQGQLQFAYSGGGTLLWDFGDGNTGTSANGVHQYTNDGVYNVCLTVTDTCGTDSSCQTVNIILDNIREGLGKSWQVVPNPSKGQTQCRAAQVDAGWLDWELHNQLGQRLLQGGLQHPGGQFSFDLDLTALPVGMYFLSFKGESGQTSLKLLKE